MAGTDGIEIRGEDLVKDIRSGMAASQLMSKYRLTRKGLDEILRQLSDVGGISPAEIYGRSVEGAKSANPGNLRFTPRISILLPLQICSEEEPEAMGIIRDISDTGIMAKGITAAPGEDKKLIVQADEFFELLEFRFKGTCRWAKYEENDQDCLAGFEITEISHNDLNRLQDLLQLIS